MKTDANLRSAVIVLAAVALAPFPADGATTFLGPTAYLSFNDSPFSTGVFQYFHLEDFEDLSVDTPGLSASGGEVTTTHANRDSVDADDGAIDGTSIEGHGYVAVGTNAKVTYDFSETLLGAFPTHAGLVWTDGGSDTAGAATQFTFEAFDASGVSLGTVDAVLGDGLITGQTAEDRFFGVVHSGGISRLTMQVNGPAYVDTDHVQYGLVPEPSRMMFLMTGALLSLALRRNARRRGPMMS